MRIGIPANGKTLDALVDDRYARAPFLLFVDLETLKVEALENKNMNKTQGAGTATSQDLVKGGADVVISINVGPNAWDVLKEFEVKVFKAEKGMSVKEAVEAYKKGELKEINEPSQPPEGHGHHHH